MKKFLFAIIILMMAGGVCEGAINTAYVRSDGSDADCDGDHDAAAAATPHCAFLTLTKALSAAVNKGGTIYLANGEAFAEADITTALAGASTDYTTITSSGRATINVSNNTTTYAIRPKSSLKFDQIDFGNPVPKTGKNWISYSTCTSCNLWFEDCTFDMTDVLYSGAVAQSTAAPLNVYLYRSTVKNTRQTNGFVSQSNSTSVALNLYYYANLWNNAIAINRIANANNPGGTIVVQNNTFVKMAVAGAIDLNQSNEDFTFENNIVASDIDYLPRFLDIQYTTTGAYFYANPSKFVARNNIFYNISGAIDSTIGSIIASWDGSSVGYVLPIVKTNRFINPGFTDYTNDDFTLAAGGHAAQKGNSNHPTGGDVTGAAWSATALDVGCYSNPAAANLSLNADTVAFTGDSIMSFTANGIHDTFEAANPTMTVPEADVNLPGAEIQALQWFVDKVIYETAPDTIILTAGINNINSGIKPSLATVAEHATEIDTILAKISDAGITPIWMGIPSKIGNPPDNSTIMNVNRLVQKYCRENKIRHTSMLVEMIEESADWKTDYYTDLTSDVHPNDAGKQFIGTLASGVFNDVYRCYKCPKGLNLLWTGK